MINVDLFASPIRSGEIKTKNKFGGIKNSLIFAI